VDYETFYTLSSVERCILIYIARTVPIGSTISEEELLSEDPPTIVALASVSVLDVRQAIEHLVANPTYLQSVENQEKTRFMISKDMSEFVNFTLPTYWPAGWMKTD